MIDQHGKTSPGTPSDDDRAVRRLYEELLARWNERSGRRMAELFEPEAHLVGFDGTPINGRAVIESEMTQIFGDHQTARYVGIVREVRFLSPTVAILRAVAGMVPPGHSDLNPNVNSIQSLVATKREGAWLIALYQNTPAAFHRRPDAARALTEELEGRLR